MEVSLFPSFIVSAVSEFHYMGFLTNSFCNALNGTELLVSVRILEGAENSQVFVYHVLC